MENKKTVLSAFLKGQRKEVGDIEIYLSSFDEPVIARMLSGKEGERLQRDSYVVEKYGPKGRKSRRTLDPIKYQKNIALAAIFQPDLQNDEIQKSYGVTGEEALYDEMFNAFEQQAIVSEIMSASGINDDQEDVKDDAKN